MVIICRLLLWIIIANYKLLDALTPMNKELRSRFSYEGETGPENWPKIFEGCSGTRQSPIALSKSKSLPSSFKPLEFINYDVAASRSLLLNNGHSAQVFIENPDGVAPLIRGGGLKNDFRLMQYHFHWGMESDRGSEHTINGKRYVMEMHLVHYNTKYGDITEAMTKTDGIAVVAVLFKKSSRDNKNLGPLVEGLATVLRNGDHEYLSRPMHVVDILPKDKASFYRYSGSLTTPNCDEIATWTIFTSFAPISERQLNAFRSLEGFGEAGDDDVEHIGDNFRPLQKLNNRLILLNTHNNNNHFSLKKNCRYPNFCFLHNNEFKVGKIKKFFSLRAPKYFWY